MIRDCVLLRFALLPPLLHYAAIAVLPLRATHAPGDMRRAALLRSWRATAAR